MDVRADVPLGGNGETVLHIHASGNKRPPQFPFRRVMPIACVKAARETAVTTTPCAPPISDCTMLTTSSCPALIAIAAPPILLVGFHQRQPPATNVYPPRLRRHRGERHTAPERGGRLQLPGTHTYLVPRQR